MHLFPYFRYDTVVQDSFRVTKACIEPATAADKVTSLFLEHDAEEFIVANLDKKNLNEDLDIAFTAGEKIGFKVGMLLINVLGIEKVKGVSLFLH